MVMQYSSLHCYRLSNKITQLNDIGGFTFVNLQIQVTRPLNYKCIPIFSKMANNNDFYIMIKLIYYISNVIIFVSN